MHNIDISNSQPTKQKLPEERKDVEKKLFTQVHLKRDFYNIIYYHALQIL